MNQPIVFTVNDIVSLILSIAALITAIGVIAGAIMGAIHFFRKPNQTQDDRLKALEDWQKQVNERLDAGEEHFGSIDESIKVMLTSTLALLAHGIDGNSIDPMKKAKATLEEYLINHSK